MMSAPPVKESLLAMTSTAQVRACRWRAEPVTSHRGWLVTGSVIAGVLLAVVWSNRFVDGTIGETVADSLLGRDARTGPGAGVGAIAVFAFVAGLAGSVAACSVAALSALGPLARGTARNQGSVLFATRALGWLALGACTVASLYGAVGVLLADRLPQLSTSTTSGGMPVRLIQSTVVFTVIGLVLVWLGLAEFGVLPHPLSRFGEHFPQAMLVTMGALIGAFLVGRPYGLFFAMFRKAAEIGNPLLGALAFGLESLGNVVLVALLFLAAQLVTARRRRGRAAYRARAVAFGAVALLLAGTFTAVYWGIRIPSHFGLLGLPFPTMPWNA
jgi:hypothetical protein